MAELEGLTVGGTLASGKDTVGGFLAREYGWQHIPLGDIVRTEVKRRGLTLDRVVQQEVANQLRQETKDAGILGAMAVERYLEEDRTTGLTVTGIRTPAEHQAVTKRIDSVLIYLDAPIKERFERLKSRGRIGDEVTFAEFKRNEEREMHSQNNYEINHSAVREAADIYIYNDGSLDDLYGQIVEVVEA